MIKVEFGPDDRRVEDLISLLIANEKMVIMMTPDIASMATLGQIISSRCAPDFKYIAHSDGVFMYRPSKCELNGKGYGMIVVNMGSGLFCWVNQVPWTDPIPIRTYKEVLQEELNNLIAKGESDYVH